MNTSNVIVGFDKKDNGTFDLFIKCNKCCRNNKYVLDKMDIVICKCCECNNRIVIIPINFSRIDGGIVDYYVKSYKWYLDTNKEWKDNEKLSIESMNKEDKAMSRLKYFKRKLISHW